MSNALSPIAVAGDIAGTTGVCEACGGRIGPTFANKVLYVEPYTREAHVCEGCWDSMRRNALSVRQKRALDALDSKAHARRPVYHRKRGRRPKISTYVPPPPPLSPA